MKLRAAPRVEDVVARLGAKGPGPSGWYTARCPFHDDNGRPNLRFTADGYNCMRCEAKGPLGRLAEAIGMAPATRPRPATPQAVTETTTYDYVDESGVLLFQVVRSADKRFSQRRPDGSGGWSWNLGTTRRVLYRLPEVLSAPHDQALFVVEGEKDVNRLWAEGLPATTNPMGAGKWRDEYSEALRGRYVVILPDHDEPGRQHAQQVARSLDGAAASVRVVALPGLPEKGDVSDWFDAGGTIDELKQLTASAPVYTSDSPGDAAERPRIVVTNRYLHDLAADAWDALVTRDGPPQLFRHAGAIAQVERDDDGRARIVHLTHAALRGRLDRCADWVRRTDEGERPARPPKDVVEDLDALPQPLPVLRGITGTPTFAADGTLITAEGYQPETRLYYDPIGQPVPPVPACPDETDVRRAKQLLFQDWLVDFPFYDDASLANAIGCAVTPVARELIAGPTPLQVFDAPAPGTGKGKLANGIALVVSGTEPVLMAEPRSEEELRKRITSLLCNGMQVAMFDNVKRPVRSGVLAAVLTAPSWTDRILGRSQTVQLPVRTVWMLTGNNVKLDNEIARRVVWIRLDAKRDRPWERANFHQSDLDGWLRRHRPELVWALLVLVQHWLARGRPVFSGSPLGSYEAWCGIVGGILDAAGIHGFLANREELYRRADEETEEWRAFTLEWWRRHGNTPVKAAELVPLAQEFVGSVFEGAKDNDRSLATRLGKALGKCRDRRYGDLFVRQAGDDTHNGGAFWRLEPGEDDAWAADVDPLSSPSSAQHPQESGADSDTNAEDAERADIDSAPDQLLFSDAVQPGEQNFAEPGAISYPHVPQHPQPDSNSADPAAEDGRKMPRSLAQHPRCRRCHEPLDAGATSNLCAGCRDAWLREMGSTR